MPCPVSWAAEEAAAGRDLLPVPGAAWAAPSLPLPSSPTGMAGRRMPAPPALQATKEQTGKAEVAPVFS